jgi:glycosyltransferase involved in cell wall biosynthesis
LKFSIILPTYNRANLISKAIESVINQTYQNWELIIVDDGSIDNTKEVVERFVKANRSIIYLYQKNKERSAARNNGIKNAIGDFICFLDSDDLFHKTHLEEFYKLKVKNNFKKGLYVSGFSYTEHTTQKENYDLSHSNNLEFVLLNTISTPRGCVDNSILKANLFNENIRIGEDMDLWMRILTKYPLFYHRNKTVIQIEHPQRSVNLGSEKEHLTTLKGILNDHKNDIKSRYRFSSLSNAYFNIAKKHIKNKSQLKAIYYTTLSLLINLRNNQTRHKLLLLLSMLNLYSIKVKNEYKKS